MKPLTTPSGGTFTSQDDGKTGYSKGIWSIEHGQLANKGQIFIVADEIGNHHKQCVARIGYAYDKDGNDLRDGNARLLCAAKTLLEACQAALVQIKQDNDERKVEFRKTEIQLQNAIDTATAQPTPNQKGE